MMNWNPIKINWKVACGVIFLGVVAYGQGTPAPFVVPQYFTNNGIPNALGTLCSFSAGTSTPLATYTTYDLGTQNPQCVPLNVAGRPAQGIWLDPTKTYKFVLKDSTSVTIWTVDGIPGSGTGGGGGGGGTLWNLSGTTIYNQTGTKVCISSAACTSALAQLNVVGTSSGTNYLVRIDDAANAPGITLAGSGNVLGYYAADSGGLRLRSGDGSSQMTVQQGNVTVANGSASGSTTFDVKSGSSQGSNNLVALQDSSGAALAWADSAGRWVSPLFNATSTGADLAFKTSTDLFSVNGFGDISANGQLNLVGTNDSVNGADNAALKINGTAVIDNAGNATFTTLTCTGVPCGTGGSGGAPAGVTNSIQIKASPSAFGGDANFAYNPGTGIVQLLGSGYVTSQGGFLATGANVDIIQAPNGGVTGKYLYAADSLFLAQEATPALSAAGQARFYLDSTSHKSAVSQNGGAYANVATATGALTNGNCVQIDASGNFVDAGGPCTTGGGGGTVSAGGANNVAYYPGAGTTVGGSNNFTWNNGTQQLAVTSTAPAVAGITVLSGYVNSAGGFITASSSTNAIQAPNGQVAGKTLFASDSLLFAEEAVPALSGAGQTRIYMDSSLHILQISQNGSAYASFGSGGGVSSITGTANQVIANVPTGAVVLSLPQSIATTSNTVFGSVTTGAGSTPVFQSGATTSQISFKNTNNLFSVNGFGDLTANGQVNVVGTNDVVNGADGSALKVNGVKVIGADRSGFFVNLNVIGTCTGCGGGGGVTSAAGTANQVLVNGTTGAQTGAVTFSLPQSIGTTNQPTFAGVFANGAFNSTVTGAAVAFQTANTRFIADGDGNVSAFTQFNVTGGGASPYKVSGVPVINGSGAFVGSGVNVVGGSVTAGTYISNGGFTLIDSARNGSLNNLSINGGNISLSAAGAIFASAFVNTNSLEINGVEIVTSSRGAGFNTLAVNSTALIGGPTITLGGLQTAGAVNFSAITSLTAPGGSGLDGTFTCPGGQHVSQLVISKGILVGSSCS